MYSRLAGWVNSSGVTGASFAVPGTVLRAAVLDWVFWAMCRRSYPSVPPVARWECLGPSRVLAVIPRKCGYPDPRPMLSRRTFLGVGLALAARHALAFGEAARLSFAQVRHRGRWDPSPDGLSRPAWDIANRTRIEPPPTIKSTALAD